MVLDPVRIRANTVRILGILARMRPGAGLVHNRNLHKGNLDIALARYDDACARLNEIAQFTFASNLQFRLMTAVGWLVMHGYGADVGQLWPTCDATAIRELPLEHEEDE
jgi:hypothetical protein